MIDVGLLDQELETAGLEIAGCDSNGKICFLDGEILVSLDPAVSDQAITARVVLAAHDHTKAVKPPTIEERLVACEEALGLR